jgi:hypothetical protein
MPPAGALPAPGWMESLFKAWPLPLPPSSLPAAEQTSRAASSAEDRCA